MSFRTGLVVALREEKIVWILECSATTPAVFKCLQAVAQETCQRTSRVRHGCLSGGARFDMSNLLQYGVQASSRSQPRRAMRLPNFLAMGGGSQACTSSRPRCQASR